MYPCITRLSINPPSAENEGTLERSGRIRLGGANSTVNSRELHIQPTLRNLFGCLSRRADIGNLWHVSLQKTSDSTTASSQLIQLDYHEAIKKHINREAYQSIKKEFYDEMSEPTSPRSKRSRESEPPLPEEVRKTSEIPQLEPVTIEQFEVLKQREVRSEDTGFYVMLLLVNDAWQYGQLQDVIIGRRKHGNYQFTQSGNSYTTQYDHSDINKAFRKKLLYLWKGKTAPLTVASIEPLLTRIGKLINNPVVTETLGPTEAWNLEMEYDVHCKWIAELYAPSLENETELTNSFDRVMLFVNNTQFKPFPRDPRGMTAVDFVQRIKASSEAAQRHVAQGRDALTFPQIDNAVMQPRFKKYIKNLMETLSCSTLYGNATAKDRQEEDREEEPEAKKEVGLQWEHVTPLSWMRLTAVLYQFQYAHHDPVMLGLATATENLSRGNKPLGFIRNAGDNSWKLPYNAHRPALARIVVYASLTYPLLCQSGQPPAMTSSSPQPTGVASYIEQMNQPTTKAILAELRQPPEDWEVDLAVLFYLHFEVVNPFVFSRQFREDVANPLTSIHKLLMRRIKGVDLTSSALLMELVQLKT